MNIFWNGGNSIWMQLLLLLSHFSRVWLWDPTNGTTSGFSVLQDLAEFAQTHVHWVVDAIQPSHPLCPLLLLLSIFPGISVMNWLFASGGQRIGVSASASVLPMSIQDWFPLEWTCWISLLSKGLLGIFSNTTTQKHQFFGIQSSLWSNSHIHTWLLEKTIALTIQTFVGKVMSLLFNMLSRFVIAYFTRSKHLLISWQQSPSAVILEPRKIKSVPVSIVSPSICHEVMGLRP